jgi:hypothetical protein
MPERKLPVVPNEDLIHSHVMKLADFLGKWTDTVFLDSDRTRNMFHAATAYVTEVVKSAQNNIPRAQANEVVQLPADDSRRYQDIIGIAYGYDHGLIDSVSAMQQIVDVCSGGADRKARGE